MRMWRSSIPLLISGDSAGKKGSPSDSIPADMIYTRRGVSEGWFVCFPFACSSGSGPTWSLDKLRNFNKITSPHTLLCWQNTNFNLSWNNLRINIQFFMTRRRYFFHVPDPGTKRVHLNISNKAGSASMYALLIELKWPRNFTQRYPFTTSANLNFKITCIAGGKGKSYTTQ